MELKPLKTDVPLAHSIASHTDTTATGLQLNELVGGGNTTLHNHSALYQPLHANLTNFATLTYAADSFVAMSGANTFLLRTLAQTRADLGINLVENTALTTWAGSGSITTVGALASGSIAAGFTSISTDYTDAKCTDAAADNTAANQTSHADVVIDGDFASNGLLNRTGAGAYSILSLGVDVQAYHANLAAIAGATWTGAASITTLGTIAAGTWAATDVAILHGGTGQSTAQAAINALTQVSGATNEHILTKDTASGNAIWKAAGAHTHDGDTLQFDGVNSDLGAFPFTTGGLVTFNQSIKSANFEAANKLTACATNAGALDFSAASKILTVEDDAVVSQDYSTDGTPQFAKLGIGHAANNLLDMAQGGGTFTAQASLRTFAANVTLGTYWNFIKSHSDSLDTYVETIDDELLGTLRFYGVDDVPSLQQGVSITAKQNGVAATGFIPTDLFFTTRSDTAINTNQLVLHHDGDVGIGIATPGIESVAGRRYLTIKGLANSGVLEFAGGEADASGKHVGRIQFVDMNSTLADTRRAAIHGVIIGTTATKRGGELRFYTGDDNVSGLVQQVAIKNDGGVFMYNLKSGTTQANAGAAAGELYVDTDDANRVHMGV